MSDEHYFAQTYCDAVVALADAVQQAYAALGRAVFDALNEPPIVDRARDYQHARMVAALTCPWAPPGPTGEVEV